MVVFFLVRFFRDSGGILCELRRKNSWEQCQRECTHEMTGSFFIADSPFSCKR